MWPVEKTDDGDCVSVLNPGNGGALLFSDSGTGANVAVAKTTGQLSAAALTENVACDADSAASVIESDDGSSRVACVEEEEDEGPGQPTSNTSSESTEFPAYAIALMTLTVVCAAAGGFYYFAYEGGDNAEMRKTAEQEMKNQSKPPARAAPVPATSGALV